MMTDFSADIAVVQKLDMVSTILDLVCQATGMGFAAVTRVTDDHWVACSVRDTIDFGVEPGTELQIVSTPIDQIRAAQELVVVDHLDSDHSYAGHPVASYYGFQSYISVPILLPDHTFFGTLCAFDPKPTKLSKPETIAMFTAFALLLGRQIHATKQIEDRAADLHRAEDALRQSQKMDAIGQLTGGVAHDFNNLLTVIRGSVDVLRRPGLSEEKRRRYVDAIGDTADRATRLTGQLLAFARRSSLQPEVFDVCVAVAGVKEMVATLTGARIEIVLESYAYSCFVRADPSQFDTALVNLIVNARDAMQGEGRLLVSIDRAAAIPPVRAHDLVRGDYIAIAIADSGSGIAPEVLARIFEPFYTTKAVGTGTGLGLSQVFGFAKQSGGEIRVESVLGAGTTFTLYLPMAATPGPGAIDPSAAGEGALSVLIVDDNVELGGFTSEWLGELGHRAAWVGNAEEALHDLAGDPIRFNVILSDVVMPGMNGVDFAHEVRRLYPELPLVLTSGYSDVLAEQGTSGFELV